MENKTISLNDVKTPKTVEGFRENLKKYYMCFGDELYVQQGNVKIDELNSLSDLYDLYPDPMITPQVYWDKDDQIQFMVDCLTRVKDGHFFDDDKNYTLYDSMKEYLENGHPMWISVDNKLLRDFYVKTLGDYSGYVTC